MDMLAVRIILLCIAAALLCTSLRVHRPEISLALSLAVGLSVMLMLLKPAEEIAAQMKEFLRDSQLDTESFGIIFRAAGIAVLSELGVQICCDAGESALAGRIRLAARLTMLGLAMPFVVQIFAVLKKLTGGG